MEQRPFVPLPKPQLERIGRLRISDSRGYEPQRSLVYSALTWYDSSSIRCLGCLRNLQELGREQRAESMRVGGCYGIAPTRWLFVWTRALRVCRRPDRRDTLLLS
jgi:hypothetical protein